MLVIDTSDTQPSTWDEVEALLLDAFRRSKDAFAAETPIVYVVSGPAVYGHADPLASALATGLLGGARSLAAEGQRKGIPVHAVTVAPGTDSREMVTWLSEARPPTGQVLHVDATHVGRPAA